MSVSLDDIWSEPLAEEPSLPPPPPGLGDDDDEDNVFRPTKRRRSTLFLGGSDDEDEDTSRKAAPPGSSARPDIDSLFEDLEDIPTSRLSNPSRPFDLAARRREAQARAEKEAPSSSFPQYAVQSSSPPRDAFDGDGKGGNGSRKDEDAGAGKKRKIAKLDEDRLLGKDGLPALVQVCKDFKPRGKGHELADLNRLFSLYQFWSHKMYPRTQFSDTVNRVEKLCHSKRMISALSGWRDKVHGTINGKNIPEDDTEMRSDNGDGDDIGDEQRRERIEEDVFGPRRDNTASSSSRASSEAAPDSPILRPPSSASSEHNNSGDMAVDDDDPFDFDALLQQEEETRLAQDATTKTPAVKTKGGTAGRDFTFDEDEEELWAELHDEAFEEASGPARSSFLADKVLATTNTTANTSSGNEDDPWDILDEIENEQKQIKSTISAVPQESAVLPSPRPEVEPVTSTGAADNGTTRAADAVSVTPAKSVSSNDDDWDDMYV